MENEMVFTPEEESEAEAIRAPEVTVKTHFDFKLEGWPASVALVTLCLSCVMIYGIAVWSKTRTTQTLPL